MLLLLACAPEPAAVLPEPPPAPPPPPAVPHLSTEYARTHYDETRAALKARRLELARQDTPGVLDDAHDAVFEAVRGALLPAWFGTPWDFNGTSAEPGEGQIACGYLVSTVLQHAGFRLERYKLAQQASEHIVRTFAPPPSLTWARSRDGVEAALPRDGLYVVGLDHHVGFLSRETLGGVPHVEFCHSSYVGTVAVTCEPLSASPGFASNAYVIGELLTDTNLRTWLDGAAFVTSKPANAG